MFHPPAAAVPERLYPYTNLINSSSFPADMELVHCTYYSLTGVRAHSGAAAASFLGAIHTTANKLFKYVFILNCESSWSATVVTHSLGYTHEKRGSLACSRTKLQCHPRCSAVLLEQLLNHRGNAGQTWCMLPSFDHEFMHKPCGNLIKSHHESGCSLDTIHGGGQSMPWPPPEGDLQMLRY